LLFAEPAIVTLCFVGIVGSFDAHKKGVYGYDVRNDHKPKVTSNEHGTPHNVQLP
jgi:hypothetical protein